MPWRAVAGFSRPVQVPACRLARSDRPLALPWVCRLRRLSSRRWVGMPLAEDPRGSAGIGCAETFVSEAVTPPLQKLHRLESWLSCLVSAEVPVPPLSGRDPPAHTELFAGCCPSCALT